ncbi:MAG: DUF790 family protein [Pyrinomonadaceae bacterium]|nr:DUF790 family protein [Pyrinomonadaceae bacterium]
MLTSDLALSWQRGGRTGPRSIDTRDPSYLHDANELIKLFEAHAGHTRAELEQKLTAYVGVGIDYKILRGLIKLLTDRCAFEIASPVDPIEIRRQLFLKSRAFHPVTAAEDARTSIVTEVARELNHPPETLLANLYADLPENQKLAQFETISDKELLELYNVAQAQALLYRCVEMRLWVEPQNTAAYRELFALIKAYRLIHSIKGSPATGYEVRLDGPVSMFHRSQKYGVQMAVFFPALLLCAGWRLRAEIAQKPGTSTAFFELDSNQRQLRSHYLEATPYQNPVPEKLYRSWQSLDGEWKLERGSQVVDLGDSAFIPDFILRHADGRQVYLEILGFWTPRYLQGRLKEFAHAKVKNFILAAWDELRGSRDPLARVPPHVIVFKTSLAPAIVVSKINELYAAAEEEK